jgi:hypothetical protein
VTFNVRKYWPVVLIVGAVALASAYRGGSHHDAPMPQVSSNRPAEKAVPVDPPKVESFAAPLPGPMTASSAVPVPRPMTAMAPIPRPATAPAPKPGRPTAVPMPVPATAPPP